MAGSAVQKIPFLSQNPMVNYFARKDTQLDSVLIISTLFTRAQDWSHFRGSLLESQDHMDCILMHNKSGVHPNIIFLFYIYFNVILIYG